MLCHNTSHHTVQGIGTHMNTGMHDGNKYANSHMHTAPALAPTVDTCFRRYMFMMCSDRTPLYSQFTINLDLVLPFSHYIS